MIPLRIVAFQPRIVITVAALCATLAVTTLLFYQVNAQSVGLFVTWRTLSTSFNTGELSAQGGAGAAAGSTTAVAPLPEMHIANNGLVLLRDAQVISTSGSTIQVEMNWNSVQFTWVVRTDSNTLFFTAAGEKEISPTIQTGDIVTITGLLLANGAHPAIDAEYIHIE